MAGMTEQELIMKFSAAIKRASGASRALLHHQRNWGYNTLVDTLDLINTMALSEATNSTLRASFEEQVKQGKI